jgi:hypothetical protein
MRQAAAIRNYITCLRALTALVLDVLHYRPLTLSNFVRFLISFSTK